MKLKDRRNFQVMNRIRDIILDSEKGIGVRIEGSEFADVEKEYSGEEVMFALRHLKGKGYLISFSDAQDLTLSAKGYDEWLFPNGPTDEKSIFVSYATEDKALAGKLKEVLEGEGWRIFLAHEDIEPTAKWRDRIISDLKSCNIFIALRSEIYATKQYTEQECGFALALNKRILSLCIGTKAENMGFCSEFQGQSFDKGDEDSIFDYCKKQLGSIIKKST